jgi:hypothetical protein
LIDPTFSIGGIECLIFKELNQCAVKYSFRLEIRLTNVPGLNILSQKSPVAKARRAVVRAAQARGNNRAKKLLKRQTAIEELFI